ncbi:MAG: ribosomal L7Ae/L30e/S12e/Gadd45 family protein [Clostridia bacterium]|nr:ribosomal L7Ae/L30e/S12e/Gadd45 family protein [Clostridia bacterium]MBQ5601966.1 ribosomal L7Ae/L30e/S12e/Gadd45 family protein [Clostridia bacterium]
MDNYISRILGLARRAGYIVFGTTLVRDAVRGKKKPYLVLLASDASENSYKRIYDSCVFYKTPLAVTDITSEELGKIIGKGSDVVCVALTDEGMAKAIINKLDKKMFISAENGESAGGRA